MSGTNGNPAKANVLHVSWRSPTVLLLIGAAMFVATAASPVLAGDVAPGSDIFISPGPGQGAPSPTYDVLLLPADMFGPGSDPWSGVVHFEGQPFPVPGPLGGERADTIVERLTTAVLPDDYNSQDTVDTQMIALDLISTAPITVTFNGGTDSAQYDIRVCLSTVASQPIGLMTLQHLCPEGGRLTSVTRVIPKLTFDKVSGGPSGELQVILDPSPQLDLFVTDGCWSHTDAGFELQTTTGGTADHDCDGVEDVAYPASSTGPNGFFLGVCWYPCDGTVPPRQDQTAAVDPITQERNLLIAHGITPPPPECKPKPDGLSCTDECPDPTEICVPTLVWQRVAGPRDELFPPAGFDVLTPTTGQISIMQGPFTDTFIITEPPNMTVIERQDPVDTGTHREIETEIVAMELVAGGVGGGVFVHLNTDWLPSLGGVIGAASPIYPDSDFPAESFFDVYVTVDIPDLEMEGLWHMEPIPLEASDITDIPPYGTPFMTPPWPLWPGVELLTSEGLPTGLTLIEVIHIPPPPPPDKIVIDCECIDGQDPDDPNACHVNFDQTATWCTGPCPPPMTPDDCILFGTDTDGDLIDDQFFCQCEELLPPPPDYHGTYYDPLYPADSWAVFGTTELPPIPADYFGPGSDPFEGQVYMKGDPIDPATSEASTIMQRSADPVLPAEVPPASGTVELEIVELSLVSTDPITVTYMGGQDPEEWDVRVDLSDILAPMGSLTATKTHNNGGTFDSTLHVQPRFTFTKVGDPGDIRVLDTGFAGIAPIAMNTNDAPFVHSVSPHLAVFYDPAAQWVSGINEITPGDPSSQIEWLFFAQTQTGAVTHGVIPPPQEEEETKWSQLPHGSGEGYDEPSNYWWDEGRARGDRVRTPRQRVRTLHAGTVR